MVGKAAATTSGPTVAQGIIINGNQNVTCTWAAVSVLGNENGNDAGLRYTWSVTGAAPRREGDLQYQRHQRGEECHRHLHRGRHVHLDGDDRRLQRPVGEHLQKRAGDGRRLLHEKLARSGHGYRKEPATGRADVHRPVRQGDGHAPAALVALCMPPRCAATFTTNGAATTVTFGMAGTYMLYARDTTQSGVFFYVTASVNQTLTSIAVSPSACSVILGTTQQFTAQGLDQFGRPMATLPPIAWKASSGTISTAGLFTAPSTGSACTVTAVSGTLTGTAAVTLKAASPTPTPTPTPQNTTVAALVQSLDADGSISRNDMIEILRQRGAEGTLSAATSRA